VDVSADADLRASRLAAAIGEPPRARILYCLADGRARTSTELAIVANTSRSPLRAKHAPSVTYRTIVLRPHGWALGVALHDCFMAKGWLEEVSPTGSAYELPREGTRAVAALGIDPDAALASRRRLAFACVDWSERRPHLGGALGAAVLRVALARRWVVRELDSRALAMTTVGRREMFEQFALDSSRF
jgi:hypothetical protein